MGYSTFFKGGIEIKPLPSDDLITKLNVWLGTRHHAGYEKVKEYSDMLCDRVYQPDGPRIPNVKKVLQEVRKWHRINPTVPDSEVSRFAVFDEIAANGFEDIRLYSEPGQDMPSLWSNLQIIKGKDRAFLVWNQAEKSYAMDKWIRIVVNILAKLNYTCNGVITTQGEDEDDTWSVLVNNNQVTKKTGHTKEPTFTKTINELIELLENNHSYNEPCCSPYLTVSTAHVSDKTIELINQDQEGASMPELEGFVIYRKTLYNEIVGWFLYIDLNADASPWPEDLFAIAGLAKEHGADLVCLDRDGPIVEDLPFFESKI